MVRNLPSLLSTPSREDAFYPVQQWFDQLYDEFFSNAGKNSIKSRQGFPRWDVYQTDEEYVVEVATSGLNAEDIKVEILPDKTNEFGLESKNRHLKISGKMSEEQTTPENAKFFIKELRRTAFERILTLPEQCRDDPKATLKNGILRLSWPLPKQEARQTKLIQIENLD